MLYKNVETLISYRFDGFLVAFHSRVELSPESGKSFLTHHFSIYNSMKIYHRIKNNHKR